MSTWPPNPPLSDWGDYHPTPPPPPWQCRTCQTPIPKRAGGMPLRCPPCQVLYDEKDLAPLEEPPYFSAIRQQLKGAT